MYLYLNIINNSKLIKIILIQAFLNGYTGSQKVPASFDVIKKPWECRRQFDLFLSLAISAPKCGIITVGFPFFLKGVLSLLLPSGEIIRRKYREQIGGSKRKLFL